MACNLPFHDVPSQKSDTMCFLTNVTTPGSWIFIENGIFSRRTTQAQTSYQLQPPSQTYKSISLSLQGYQKPGYKDTKMMFSPPTRLTGYIDVVYQLRLNQ